jgi:hypothetical protein
MLLRACSVLREDSKAQRFLSVLALGIAVRNIGHSHSNHTVPGEKKLLLHCHREKIYHKFQKQVRLSVRMDALNPERHKNREIEDKETLIIKQSELYLTTNCIVKLMLRVPLCSATQPQPELSCMYYCRSQTDLN